jgi:hypothetical protein
MSDNERGIVGGLERQVHHLHPCEQTRRKLMELMSRVHEAKMITLRAQMPQANALTLGLTAMILEMKHLW